jgi:hypothetical protein
MIASNHHGAVIDESLGIFIKQMECASQVEVVQALEQMVYRAAMIVAQKTTPDHAQCVLYAPYSELSQKMAQGGQA